MAFMLNGQREEDAVTFGGKTEAVVSVRSNLLIAVLRSGAVTARYWFYSLRARWRPLSRIASWLASVKSKRIVIGWYYLVEWLEGMRNLFWDCLPERDCQSVLLLSGGFDNRSVSSCKHLQEMGRNSLNLQVRNRKGQTETVLFYICYILLFHYFSNRVCNHFSMKMLNKNISRL